MDSAAAFTRPPPPIARTEHLLREADREHHRTLAFWNSYDANGHSGQRWADAAVAASKARPARRSARPGAVTSATDAAATEARAS
jgi:hypothetical protein